jgi:5-methylcytosine-specific restriction endonuclease McrA
MLFSYVYVPHPLEKLQNWLEHLVKEVWCKPQKRCSLRMLEPEFRKVLLDIRKNARRQDYLWKPICSIHDLCRDQLSDEQRANLAKWFDDNNNIEALCSGSHGVSPITYEKIALINAQLARELKVFCTNLWSEVRTRKPVTDLIGTLRDHFKEFRKANHKGICPFCGIARIEGVFSSTQEDYDHYLPKGSYAFNSVALKNLAPICDKCNKKYKLQQDPLHKQDGNRRKAFYAYAVADVEMYFSITLAPANGGPIDPSNLCPDNIVLEITAPGREQELEGWKELFNIEQRYKDLCCEGDTGGSYWLELVLDEMKSKGITPTEAIAMMKRYASISRWADANFLRVPFLEGCQAAGLIR